MKKLIYAVLILLAAFLTGQFLLNSKKIDSSNEEVTQVQIGTTVYKVEVADDDNKRSLGLSYRQSLSQGSGLLFLFDVKERHSFWMKDMHFPIDIIWIDNDTIVNINENVPIPLTATYLPTYTPNVSINRVLEINAGEVKKNNIKIGDKINYLP